MIHLKVKQDLKTLKETMLIKLDRNSDLTILCLNNLCFKLVLEIATKNKAYVV